MLQTICQVKRLKQNSCKPFVIISRMFHSSLFCMIFLKLWFYLFSQKHDSGSHMKFTLNFGYNLNNRKFILSKGSNSSNFLFTQAQSLVLALLAGTLSCAPNKLINSFIFVCKYSIYSKINILVSNNLVILILN